MHYKIMTYLCPVAHVYFISGLKSIGTIFALELPFPYSYCDHHKANGASTIPFKVHLNSKGEVKVKICYVIENI